MTFDVVIFTDGSCAKNPGGCGGYGVYLKNQKKELSISQGYKRTTNNRMEMMAVIAGLEALKRKCTVLLYSDSRYVIDGMNKGWAKSWKKKGWLQGNGTMRKNADLWKRLLDVAEKHDVTFRWVRGHSGNQGNMKADKLATAAWKESESDLLVDEGYEAS